MCDNLCFLTVSLFIRIKDHEQEREEEIIEQKKDAEELEHFKELYIQEQMTLEQKKQEGKRNTMKAYQVSSSVIKMKCALNIMTISHS